MSEVSQAILLTEFNYLSMTCYRDEIKEYKYKCNQQVGLPASVA